jgi:hypothetical protein
MLRVTEGRSNEFSEHLQTSCFSTSWRLFQAFLGLSAAITLPPDSRFVIGLTVFCALVSLMGDAAAPETA